MKSAIENKKGIEFTLQFIIGAILVMVALMVAFKFFDLAKSAIGALPG